jgi:hypothetical protein
MIGKKICFGEDQMINHKSQDIIMVALSLTLAIYLQMKFNHEGHNYLLICLLIVIVLYFNKIKMVRFGALKLEKEKTFNLVVSKIIISLHLTLHC